MLTTFDDAGITCSPAFCRSLGDLFHREHALISLPRSRFWHAKRRHFAHISQPLLVSAAITDVSAWRTTGSEPISADPYQHITSRDSYGVHRYLKAIEISALPQEREREAERDALCRPSSCPARSRSIGNHGSDRGQTTHLHRS